MNTIFNIRKWELTVLLVILLGGLTVSCEENVTIDTGSDKKHLETVDDVYGYLQSTNNPVMKAVSVYDQAFNLEINVGLTRPMNRAVDVQLEIDESLLAKYNMEHGTDWTMVPESIISFEDDGQVLIAPGDIKSYPLNIQITPTQELPKGTYLLPIRMKMKTDGVKLSSSDDHRIFVVKCLGNTPSTDKGKGIVTICYVECNNFNPLNAGEWILKNSKKPLIDIVNLFAANINFNKETGKVFVKLNKNIQYILNNRDKYIKPLQDKGIKVCLSILGDHDGSGVANLTDEDARYFAAELKAVVDAYGLDGVDFDDEWSDYHKYTLPGFAKRGPYPYARLCYETKRAMPDKLCTVYYIGAVIPDASQDANGFDMQIDGMDPGDFIDYSYYAQYGAWSDSWQSIKGMEKRQWGPYSLDLQESYPYMLEQTVKGGYGVQVLYDLRPKSPSGENVIKKVATGLYGEEVIHSGIVYVKEW